MAAYLGPLDEETYTIIYSYFKPVVTKLSAGKRCCFYDFRYCTREIPMVVGYGNVFSSECTLVQLAPMMMKAGDNSNRSNTKFKSRNNKDIKSQREFLVFVLAMHKNRNRIPISYLATLGHHNRGTR